MPGSPGGADGAGGGARGGGGVAAPRSRRAAPRRRPPSGTASATDPAALLTGCMAPPRAANPVRAALHAFIVSAWAWVTALMEPRRLPTNQSCLIARAACPVANDAVAMQVPWDCVAAARDAKPVAAGVTAAVAWRLLRTA
jgi:hypothetical protein